MRITSVSACGLLTFEDFHLDLDEHLTLIVGPNGAGKSNFDRLFEIVIRAIQAADRESPDVRQMLQRYLGGRRAILDERGIEIRLAYQLTADFEKALLTSFVRTCVVATLLGNNFGFDTSGIEDWADGITEDHFVQLFLGEIVVHHAGTPDAQWECAIEFGFEGVQYRWEMMGARRDSLVRAEDRLRTDLQGLQLSNRLPAGLAPTATPAGSTPVEPFTTSMILPDPNTTLSCSLVFGRQPPPRSFRNFAELIGVDPVGAATGQNSHYGLAHVLWMIFRRASITTSDSRLLPSGSHSWSSESVSLQLGAEGRIPEALLRLKNGRSTEFQAFRSVQSLFHLFTHGRTMEVAMVPASADGSEAGVEGALTVAPVVLVSVNPRSADQLDELYPQVPIEFAGAGAWEAMVLAFVLGSQQSSFIILDEPAVALHPNLQRALMTHLQGLDAQIIVITHSPYFFPLAEGQGKTRVVRFERGERSDTHPAVVDESLMTKMVPKLRQTGNERIAFASRVVLAEGKIDQAGIRVLSEESQIDLDGSNVAVVDCAGRENIPDYARFCAALGLRYLAVQDGDASKPSAVKGVDAVRTAVAESHLGTLFEFSEDIETALGGVEKDAQVVSLAMRQAAVLPQIPAEISTLREKLSELVATY